MLVNVHELLVVCTNVGECARVADNAHELLVVCTNFSQCARVAGDDLSLRTGWHEMMSGHCGGSCRQ